jgi:hypothetical protein
MAEGYYWATHRRYGWRAVVLIGKDGFKHTRAFTARSSSSFNVEEFTDFKGPLRERKTAGAAR